MSTTCDEVTLRIYAALDQYERALQLPEADTEGDSNRSPRHHSRGDTAPSQAPLVDRFARAGPMAMPTRS